MKLWKMSLSLCLKVGGNGANAGVLTAKLRQLTGGGADYSFPEWQHVHDVKLDRLADLVEEMAGAMIVAYQFLDYELQRLQERSKIVSAARGHDLYSH